MKGLAIGQQANATRVFTAQDVAAYRTLTGDEGLGFGTAMVETPARSGVETAVSTPLKASVPGPLLAGMFSDLLGTKLPGRGTNWLKQQLQYPTAAKIGEAITATVEIIRLRPEKQLVNLRTTCTNSTGTLLCAGEALVLVSDLEVDRNYAG
ncbi:MAG: hypothetical protein KC419_25435 [Anaerolineales bacterium]|nr:hypothetical protein [Anaerolineales bacterium]